MKWSERWARMERHYDRIYRARFGLLPLEETRTPELRERFYDDAETYFVTSHHLREILEADGVNLPDRVSQSRVLQVCADLANAAKHGELSRPRVGQPIKVSTSTDLIVRDGRIDIGFDLFLEIGGKQFSAFSFAHQVRREWAEMLRDALAFEVATYNIPNLRALKPVPDEVFSTIRRTLHTIP